MLDRALSLTETEIKEELCVIHEFFCEDNDISLYKRLIASNSRTFQSPASLSL